MLNKLGVNKLGVTAVLVGALVSPLAACSSSGGKSPKAEVQAAVRASEGSGSLTESVVAVTPTASAKSTSSATGSYSFSASQGTFTVDTGALLGKLNVLLSGSTLYVKLPAVGLALSKGKPWGSVNITNPPAIPASVVGNLPALAGGADPSRVFIGLSDGITTATKVSAGQYTVSVDYSKSSSPLAKSEITLLGGSVVTDKVTVGSDGKISKIEVDVALSGGATETITAGYSAYGTAVNVSVPSAGDVVDAAKLLGQ